MTLKNLRILLARELETEHFVSDVLDVLFEVVNQQSQSADDDCEGARSAILSDVATTLDQARHDARAAEIELGADEIDSLTRGAL